MWAFGLFCRRRCAGRVVPVQLLTANEEVPLSHLIVCVVGKTVSTKFRWKSHPRMSGIESDLTKRKSYSMAIPLTEIVTDTSAFTLSSCPESSLTWVWGGARDEYSFHRLGNIFMAGRIPMRPHPKPIRIQNSDGWAILTSVSVPRFFIQRVTWMGSLDRGQSKVTTLLCGAAASSRPSSRPRRNHAISLGQLHFCSCEGPWLTVAPVLLPSGPPPQRRRPHKVDHCFSALHLP